MLKVFGTLKWAIGNRVQDRRAGHENIEYRKAEGKGEEEKLGPQGEAVKQQEQGASELDKFVLHHRWPFGSGTISSLSNYGPSKL